MPYIGRSTDGFGVRNRFLYLASANDTSVSGADANGATLTFTDGAYVDVYLNGVLLKAGTDYNTNTANTIASLAAMAANDEVTVVVYDVFTVGDMVSATSGGTFVGNVNFSGNIDVDGTTQLDGANIDGAVDISGATTTAAITASGVVDITNTTDASDATGDTGALRTEGGASIAKKLYVGTDLDVDGTANLDVVDIDGNVDIAGDVTFTGDNYNVTWDKSANDLSFDDNAKLTFGAGNDLQIYHTPGTGTFIDEADDGALFIRSSRVTIHKYTGETMINAAADGAVSLYYDDTLALSTASGGAVTVANGLTLSDGNLVVASGHGIDFSATANASGGSSINEVLSDYEKGTFTATLSGTSGSIGSGAGLTATWTYIKIGNFIHINGSITPSNLGSYGGTVQITGIPFAAGANHAMGIGITFHNFNSRNDASANIKAKLNAGTTTLAFTKPDTTAVNWSELGTSYLGVGGGYQDFG
jgi:hypothetical protein